MGTDQEPQNLPFPLSYSHSGFYDEHCAKHDWKLIWKIVNTPLRITVYPAWQKLAVYVEVWLHKSGECAWGLSITLKEYSCRSSLCLLYKVCCIQAVLSHIFLLPYSTFSFFVGAFIFLREHCRAWSLCPLSYVFCNVSPPLSLSLSLISYWWLLFFSLSLFSPSPSCSLTPVLFPLCSFSLMGPDLPLWPQLRWLWYTVQSTW